MSQIEVKRLLGRLITDAEFRSRAAISLQKTIADEGIVLSLEELLRLRHINFSLFGLIASTLSDSVRRN